METFRMERLAEHEKELCQLLADLSTLDDVLEVTLLDGEGRILYPNKDEHLSERMALFRGTGHILAGEKRAPFDQIIMESNGTRLIAEPVREGIYLLVALRSLAYTGLVMLDMENTTHRIRELLWQGGAS